MNIIKLDKELLKMIWRKNMKIKRLRYKLEQQQVWKNKLIIMMIMKKKKLKKKNIINILQEPV